MKLEDIKIGKRYHISYKEGTDAWSNYEGAATCVSVDAQIEFQGYSMKFECDDGELGYFEPKHVIRELESIHEEKTYTIGEEVLEDIIHALSLNKDNCIYASDTYNALTKIKNGVRYKDCEY